MVGWWVVKAEDDSKFKAWVTLTEKNKGSNVTVWIGQNWIKNT
jgi:hypothetical protein